MERQPRLFIFGLGYSARALADRLLARGWRVAGTTRDPAKAAALEAAGIEAFLFDRGRPLPPGALAGTSHLLSSVPPDAEGDPVLDQEGAALAALPGLTWAGYLSTTGIYGDHQGGWVDEESPLRADGDRGGRRRASEQAWLASGLPIHVFRLAGIYGPGRNLLLDCLAGRARRVVKPGQVFGRIHVEDIAGALEASIAHPDPPRIYNVTDDEPAANADVVAFACDLLVLPLPPEIPFEEAARSMSPMGLTFWQSCRRVSNRRLREELGYALRYPTYRDGLRALLASLPARE